MVKLADVEVERRSSITPLSATSEPRLVQSKQLLTPASGFMYAFTHTVAAYMGCAFGDRGCGVYCYAAELPIGQYTRRKWGTWVNAKVNAAEVLSRDLDGVPDRSALRIFMSSASDPYQPAEAKLRITRSLFEVFAQKPVGLLVQTRSPLVEKDFDVLQRLPFVWLSMTVETDDDAVRRALTPTCPSIERRLKAMRQARELGIKVQAAVSPMLPANVDNFATILADSADFVVVDTFFGDGANGRRTASRPLPKAFRDAAFGDWRDTSSAERLHATLRERLGIERVGWSREGFNALAVAEGERSV
jgi:DNA repair photolyase